MILFSFFSNSYLSLNIKNSDNHSLLNVLNFFEHANLHFVLSPSQNSRNSSSDQYFHQVRSNNPYVPLTTNTSFLNFTFPVSRIEKSTRIKVSFLDLLPITSSVNQVENYLLITTPDYLFIHFDGSEKLNSYRNYARRASSAKFIFFSVTGPYAIFIPRIIGDVMVQEVESILSLRHLDKVWDSLNTMDLNGAAMLTSLPTTNRENCGYSLSKFHEGDSPYICMLLIPGKKYNFTYLHLARADEWRKNCNLVDIIGYVKFRQFLLNNLTQVITNKSVKIYDCEIHRFGFVVVSNFPIVENSILGVFNPFENAIWLSLLFSCVCICLVLQFEGKGLKSRFAPIQTLRDYFLVQSILFGQSIDDQVIKKIGTKHVARPLLAIWFVACYIIMDNLYQGTIYSDLTVMHPPSIPVKFISLLMSNISIVTTTQMLMPSRDGNYIEYRSLLKDSVIPDVVKNNQDKGFVHFVKVADRKIVYVHNGNVDVSMVKNMSDSVPIWPNSSLNIIPTKKAIAIIDESEELSLLRESLNILGKRLVTKNNPHFSISLRSIVLGDQTFLSRKIYFSMQYLSQAGIKQRWSRMKEMRRTLHFVRKFGNETYSKYFVKLNSNFKESRLLISSDSDSLGPFWYLLALCAVVVAVAVVLIVLEIYVHRTLMRYYYYFSKYLKF